MFDGLTLEDAEANLAGEDEEHARALRLVATAIDSGRSAAVHSRWTARVGSERLDVHRCGAFIEPDNVASRGVAGNVGLEEIGVDATGDRPMLRYQIDLAGRAP